MATCIYNCNNNNTFAFQGVANLENLSSTLQQLWALSEEVSSQQTNRALGRYEV